jgi:hypothetical protein
MSPLSRACALVVILGCTKQPIGSPDRSPVDRASTPTQAVRPPPPSERPAPPPGDQPALAPRQVVPPPQQQQPVPPAPQVPPAPPQLDSTTTAKVELIPSCPTAYGGSYPYTPAPGDPVPSQQSPQGFLEDAKRPIAMVIIGHYVYSDVPDCMPDVPRQTAAVIALPGRFASKHDVITTKAIAGDLLRPLYTEECVHVISCDDLNGNHTCDSAAEPVLNGVNARSRYLYASVSRPARFTLTLSSRDDRFCERENYYSRCCPARYRHDLEAHTCESLDGDHRVPEKCP